jgi:hypothetical protein
MKTDFVCYPNKLTNGNNTSACNTLEDAKAEASRYMKAGNVSVMHVYQLVGICKTQAPPVEFTATDK